MQHVSVIICETCLILLIIFCSLYVSFLLFLKFSFSCDLLQLLQERKPILTSGNMSSALCFGSGLKPFECYHF